MLLYPLSIIEEEIFMLGPDPEKKYPFEGLPHQLENLQRCGFLKHFITRKNIIIGDYTYYDDPKGVIHFEKENVPYHYDFSNEKVIIGKFCALATGTTFITSSANHKLDGFSTYPFGIFGHGWEKKQNLSNLPNKGDTIVGHDVWFGYQSTIMPSVKIGNGAIIGSKAVVKKEVPPYAIVAGNPAKIIRMRFDEKTIQLLQEIAWWDWPIQKISQNIEAITGCDLDLLMKLKS